MKKKYTFLFFFVLCINLINAQFQLSEKSEISIVTAGSGTELYEAFGHSAIRIKDPSSKLDLIYNYGVFDFNQPNFYTNFAKGNMIYSLARYDFKYFIASYRKDKRWLKQQVLNLNQQEKQAYFLFLENNALPKNRNYNYDPYFDNCATILREITDSILGNKIVFNDQYENTLLTFRNLTNKEIHWNTWGSFGLNLIAGIPLDQKATSKEFLFLPDYLFDSFKNASIIIDGKSEKLIKREDLLLNFKENEPKIAVFNPFLIFTILFLLVAFITYKDVKKDKRSRYLDFTILFITGFIGALLLFLWFFSSHSTAPYNFNILWAFGPNLIIAFLILKNDPKKWFSHYFKALLFLLICIPILWIFNIQCFPLAVIPLLMLFFVRYIFLAKHISNSIS